MIWNEIVGVNVTGQIGNEHLCIIEFPIVILIISPNIILKIRKNYQPDFSQR